MACCEEPHCRSMEVPGTDSGKREANTALRATFVDCSPTWLTQPMNTSSTSAGSAPVRSSKSFKTWAAKSTGCQPDKRPPLLPPAVRVAATMNASDILSPLSMFRWIVTALSGGPCEWRRQCGCTRRSCTGWSTTTRPNGRTRRAGPSVLETARMQPRLLSRCRGRLATKGC